MTAVYDPGAHARGSSLKGLVGTACLLLASVAALLLSVILMADEIGERRDRPELPKFELDDQTKKAIEKGLKYLAAHQEDDGSWKDVVGRKINYSYVGVHDKHIGVTALACMSFMAHGNFPGRGKYGENVERGLDFILSNLDMNGYIVYGQSRMYSHAFATLFLAEIYGMTTREDVGEKLGRAVNAVIKGQNAQGAWRYKPDSQDSDLSVTVCQVMALRAARNAGIAVPVQTIKRGIEYVKKSAAPSGAFYYQIYNERGSRIISRTSLALTAAGVATLQAAGEYDTPHVKRGINYLYRNYVSAHRSRGTIEREIRHTFEFLYGQYYAIQAMYQAGGREWADYWKRLKTELLAFQYSDGRWQDLVGPNYATAMATLILQIPLDYLPIFQR
jgi:hypothetical protein